MRSTRALSPGRARRFFFSAGDHFHDGRLPLRGDHVQAQFPGRSPAFQPRLRLRRQYRRAGRRSPSGGGAVGGGPTPADKMMEKANPDLFAIASKYFPSTDGAMASKRMVRLTRTQLDLTTKTLLPAHVTDGGVAALPPDPLQTNYEYAANLGFNAGQLHALHELGRGHRRQRPRQPGQRHRLRRQQQRDRPASQTAAKTFVGARLPRDAVRRAARALCRLLHAPASTAGGPRRRRGGSGRRHPHLAELRVSRRGADRRYRPCCCPRSSCRHMSYTLADAPPETVGPVVRRARRASPAPDASRTTVDQRARDARGARQAAAVLRRLAGGQGARRVHDRALACSPSSRRRSPPRWWTRPRRS